MTGEEGLDSVQRVSANSVVVAAENQISSNVAGEAVILDLAAGMYYGLDSIATRIWDLIQDPKAVCDLRDTLLSEYEVDPSRCEQELLVLLERLAASQLITIIDDSIPAVSPTSLH